MKKIKEEAMSPVDMKAYLNLEADMIDLKKLILDASDAEKTDLKKDMDDIKQKMSDLKDKYKE